MSGISNYLAGKQAALEFNGTAFTEPSSGPIPAGAGETIGAVTFKTNAS